jgi:hypothetical protein
LPVIAVTKKVVTVRFFVLNFNQVVWGPGRAIASRRRFHEDDFELGGATSFTTSSRSYPDFESVLVK